MLQNDCYKYLYYQDRLRKLMDGEAFPPVTVEVSLSERCSHACNFCAFTWMRKNVDLDYGNLIVAIEDMAKMGVKGIMLCGNGEPLLYKHFVEVVENIHFYDIETGLVTNGSLLHKYKNHLGMLGAFTYIRFSLDAGDESTHKKVHGSNDFIQVIDNIRMLVDYKKENDSPVTIGVHYTLSKDNYTTLYRALTLCRDIGVDYFHVGPVVKSTIHSKNLPEPVILRDSEIKHLREQSSDRFNVFVSANRFDDVAGKTANWTFDKCRAQNFFTIIEADGRVFPCCHLVNQDKYCIGNINEQRFDKLWFSERHKEILNGIDFRDCTESCNKRGFNELAQSFFTPQMHKAFLG